jgi:hypothetical protein
MSCAHRPHTIDCALGPLCYIRACSIWIAWQRSSPMKGEPRLNGANSVSKFHHHNINGGAVDDTWRHRYTTFKLNLGMRYLWLCCHHAQGKGLKYGQNYMDFIVAPRRVSIIVMLKYMREILKFLCSVCDALQNSAWNIHTIRRLNLGLFYIFNIGQ